MNSFQKLKIMNKSISKVLAAIIVLLSFTACEAQIKNAKTETVKIYGNCDMCEKAIEKGNKHADFTEKQPLFATPRKGKPAFTKPVVILINRGCYSATTHFAAYMSLLPNVTLVGDRVGGGGGIPISRDLPNGWQYRFSATMQTLPDGTQIEHGVDPKVSVETGAKEELEGKDAIIEKGLEVIRLEIEKHKKV